MRGRSAPHRSDIAGPVWRNLKNLFVLKENDMAFRPLHDRILFGKWSGTEIKLDGEDLIIMKESDVMGVIDQTATMKKAA